MSYQNPVPHMGGKKFLIHLEFDFKDWIEIEEAKENIREYFKRNGYSARSNKQCTSNKCVQIESDGCYERKYYNLLLDRHRNK